MIACLLLVAATVQPECVLQQGSAPRVLLVQGARPAPVLESRLMAEMGSAGINAELLGPADIADHSTRASLVELTRQRGAFAIVRIEKRDGRTRLRIIYANPGSSNPPEELLVAGDDDALAFAWRVLDVLNARLLAARLVCHRVEQAQAEKARRDDPVPAPAQSPPESAPEPQSIQLSFEAGPAILVPLGPEPTLALGLALAIYPTDDLRLELDAVVSLLPTVLDKTQGSAEIGFCRAQLGVLYELGWWTWGRPFAGLGTGLLAVWADGQAGSGYAPRFDATAVWHVAATAGLAFDLGEAWDLRLAITVSLPYNEIGIRMGDQTVAQVGRPMLDAGLRLAWRP